MAASSSVLCRCSSMAIIFTHQRVLVASTSRIVRTSSSSARYCGRGIRALHSSGGGGGWSAEAVVVADCEKYGNKQVISLTPRLYDYILSNVREPEILRQLREETAALRGSQMQVSPDQAQLLAMLVQILGAERCIEVGVYMGYSSLAIALVLPESGRLVACERDAKSLEVAKRYYESAGVAHKVDVKHGLAADALRYLILNGEACSFDFAFVDAEKRMNGEYFELLLQLVRVGGVIVIDNVLWHGKVADLMINDIKTVEIRNFNKKIMEDKRVSISMITQLMHDPALFGVLGTHWRWDDDLPQKMTFYHKTEKGTIYAPKHVQVTEFISHRGFDKSSSTQLLSERACFAISILDKQISGH